jgi:hypothetical protein
MPRTSSVWQRVSKRRPCPVCEKPDWCMFAGEASNPDAVICARIESPKRCGESGWLHHLRHDGPTWSPRVRRIELSARRIALTPGPSPKGQGDEGENIFSKGQGDNIFSKGREEIDFDKLAADCAAAVRPEALDKLAVALGVSVESLRRLRVGWSAKHRAWAFPMSNATGMVTGIRLRLPGGKKLSVRGGKEGLFIPEGLPTESPHPSPLPKGEGTSVSSPSLSTNHYPPTTTLLIAEGPTDTAALLDLGFDAVGRPSCMGGVKLLIDFVQHKKPTNIVIVADADAPGQRGAESLATVLLAYSQSVRIIAPPSGVKDAREWRRSGATAADVQQV